MQSESYPNDYIISLNPVLIVYGLRDVFLSHEAAEMVQPLPPTPAIVTNNRRRSSTAGSGTTTSLVSPGGSSTTDFQDSSVEGIKRQLYQILVNVKSPSASPFKHLFSIIPVEKVCDNIDPPTFLRSFFFY